MSFKDMLKKSVLEGFSTDITTTKIVVSLAFTIILGIYIYFVYKYKSKSSFYSKDFNIVLAILPIVTAGIVLAMQSSLVISLGMVGALSIVRFRTAVKSPFDLLFLFWSISIGIICGAGIYEIAIFISLTITILLFLLDLLKEKRKSFLLVLVSNNLKIEEKLTPILKDNTIHYIIKSRNINEKIDFIIELKTKDEMKLLSELKKLKDIENINLLNHDGEVRI